MAVPAERLEIEFAKGVAVVAQLALPKAPRPFNVAYRPRLATFQAIDARCQVYLRQALAAPASQHKEEGVSGLSYSDLTVFINSIKSSSSSALHI